MEMFLVLLVCPLKIHEMIYMNRVFACSLLLRKIYIQALLA